MATVKGHVSLMGFFAEKGQYEAMNGKIYFRLEPKSSQKSSLRVLMLVK